MLKGSDTDIEAVSATILNGGHDVVFLVPTDTAMTKSIMDATESVRAFFKRNDLHDYTTQIPGSKCQIKAQFVVGLGTREQTLSLYRPASKSGDPRIWIYGLKGLAKPFNLLALLYVAGQLFIVNCSNKAELDNALINIIPNTRAELSTTAAELLRKLECIAGRGFVPSLRAGDTGVGMTLETLLGISENSSQLPDYKGIELKSTRIDASGRQRNRDQLFSKVPSWKLSPLGSAEKLVFTRGYIDDDGQSALRNTVSGSSVNSQGLYLDVDYANGYLRQMFADIQVQDFSPVHDMTWVISELKAALAKKHQETFWVKARHNNDRQNEQFHYVEVEHTASPHLHKLETLFETGLLTVEYTLHIKPTGKARDHGYLFKLKANSAASLFSSVSHYDLV
jgi:hypothetical protein